MTQPNAYPAGQQMPPAYNGPAQAQGEPTIDQPYYGIGLFGAVARFFRKYATFSGRASRSEFWWWVLFTFIVNFAINLFSQFVSEQVGGILSGAWWLLTLIPGIALFVRRLHDSNKSGWLIILPYACYVIAFILLFAALGYAAFQFNATGTFSDQVLAGGAGSLFGALVLMIVGFVLWLVFAVAGSRPEGARFDKR